MNDVKDILMSIPTYSEELGLDLHRAGDRFLWFLASILFAKRISVKIAIKTFKVFLRRGLTYPDAILDAGWDELVDALDQGGYVRYDFSTATNLLEAMKLLIDKYGGSVDEIYLEAEDAGDLEKRLMEFRGVGPVAINIFLRELRGIWPKAGSKPSRSALEVASRLGLDEDDVEAYESRLVRIYIEYCKRHRCRVCRLKNYCRIYYCQRG